MKIGYVLDTTLDSDAGVQQYFKGLAHQMIKTSHEVKFLVPHSPKSATKGEFAGKVIQFGKNVSPLLSTTQVPMAFHLGSSKVKKILKEEHFDIIHVSAPFSPMLGAKVIKHATCPVIATYTIYSQSLAHHTSGRLLSLLQRNAYKKIEAMIALSDAAQKECIKMTKDLIDPSEIEVIPAGVDTDAFSPDVKPLEKFVDVGPNTPKNILFLGRLEKRKGVRYLLKCFKKVQSVEKNTRLIIAGDGPERANLEKLAQDLKLKNVLFEGYIDEKLKPRYYASADICVFPALYGESFGIVLIEAMASGKPVIAFANEGYKFVLKDTPELLVEVGDVDGLAEKVLKVLGGGVRYGGNYGRFRWDNIGERVLNTYKTNLRNSQ